MDNPMLIGGVVGAVILLIVVALMMRKKDPARPASTQGSAGNFASKEALEGLASETSAKPAPAKAASSQTHDTKIEPAKKKKEDDVFKDVPPDENLVTQYQEGTGEGIEEIEERLKEDPNNEDLLDWLAFMYYSNNNLEKAIDTYERAINLNYENEHQHYYLGNAYYKKGQYDRAREEWEVVVSLKPDSKLAKNAQERIAKVNDMLAGAS